MPDYTTDRDLAAGRAEGFESAATTLRETFYFLDHVDIKLWEVLHHFEDMAQSWKNSARDWSTLQDLYDTLEEEEPSTIPTWQLKGNSYQ